MILGHSLGHHASCHPSPIPKFPPKSSNAHHTTPSKADQFNQLAKEKKKKNTVQQQPSYQVESYIKICKQKIEEKNTQGGTNTTCWLTADFVSIFSHGFLMSKRGYLQCDRWCFLVLHFCIENFALRIHIFNQGMHIKRAQKNHSHLCFLT
jgi:hypothetical protein